MILSLAAAGAFAASTSTAGAAGTYVALGDSLATGVGASSPGKGYVGLLNDALTATEGVTEHSNFDQPGATSGALRGTQLTGALARINDPTDTTFVTIDIGGNDLIGGTCSLDWHSSCPFRANFAATLDDLLGALATDPGSETLATMALYNPAAGLGPPNETNIKAELLGANGTLSATDSGADIGLNDVILQESQSRGLPMADPYPAFAAGAAPLLSGDGTHPNDAGYAAIARSFCEAMGVPCLGSSPPPPGTDTDPPQTTIDKAPKRKGSKRKVRIAFSSSEAGATFECSLDDKPFQRCSSPQRLRVSRDRHRFRVRAIDTAGNVDPSPASARFRVKRKR